MNSKLGLMAASIMLGVMSNPFAEFAEDRSDFRRSIKKPGPNIKATESDLFAKHGKGQSKRAKRRSQSHE